MECLIREIPSGGTLGKALIAPGEKCIVMRGMKRLFRVILSSNITTVLLFALVSANA